MYLEKYRKDALALKGGECQFLIGNVSHMDMLDYIAAEYAKIKVSIPYR